MSDTPVQFDPDSMTIDECIDFEDVAGIPVDKMFADGTSRAKVLKGLAFVASKRVNPDVTPAEIGGTKVTDLAGLLASLSGPPMSPSEGD